MGIENQTNYDKDMPLRVISYDGAHYRAQIGQDIKYPVITLVLYFVQKGDGGVIEHGFQKGDGGVIEH